MGPRRWATSPRTTVDVRLRRSRKITRRPRTVAGSSQPFGLIVNTGNDHENRYNRTFARWVCTCTCDWSPNRQSSLRQLNTGIYHLNPYTLSWSRPAHTSIAPYIPFLTTRGREIPYPQMLNPLPRQPQQTALFHISS